MEIQIPHEPHSSHRITVGTLVYVNSWPCRVHDVDDTHAHARPVPVRGGQILG
jgi:hypothetical protein